MTLRFLTGVAIVAAVATGLVKRHQKQLEMEGAAPGAKLSKRPRPAPIVRAPAPGPDPNGPAVAN